jgi:pyrroloquinoline quinone biosynthesis protein B
VIVRVLGSAAGGGVPQWNCACQNCQAVRAGRAPRRTQSSLAVSADGARWLLLNCSPDIAAQIEAFSPLHPPAPRGTPIAGMLLTDANIDHIGGLAVLRQRGGRDGFVVRSSATIREIATAQPAFAPFAASPHRWIDVPLRQPIASSDDDDLVGTVLAVTAIAVPGTTPGYAGRRRAPAAVVAYEIADRHTHESLLFAPVFSSINDALAASIARASVAFLDGSFYSDDELIDTELLDKHARTLGHQPVGGIGGTLDQLRYARTRIVFTHLNNSNPMLDPDSAACAALRKFGGELAYDGMELTL